MSELWIVDSIAIGSCFAFAAFLAWNADRAAHVAARREVDREAEFHTLPPQGEHIVNRGAW